MAKLTLVNNQLTIKEGLTGKIQMDMAQIRLLYMFFPASLKSWFLVSSSSQIQWVNVDAFTPQEMEKFSLEFDRLIREERKSALNGIKLVLADFGNQFVILPLGDFKKAGIDIFTRLQLSQKERIHRLNEWLGGEPQIQLNGLMSQKAFLNSHGFTRGKKTLPWQELESIQVNTVNFSTSLLLIPKGVSTGMFSFKKFKYSLGISEKKKEYYLAECDFWRNRKLVAGEREQKLKDLQDLKDQGLISAAQFRQAEIDLQKGN